MVDKNETVADTGSDNYAKKERKSRLDGQVASFEIDSRITLMVDFDLCVELGKHVIEHGTENKALYALAIMLKKMGDRC